MQNIFKKAAALYLPNQQLESVLSSMRISLPEFLEQNIDLSDLDSDIMRYIDNISNIFVRYLNPDDAWDIADDLVCLIADLHN